MVFEVVERRPAQFVAPLHPVGEREDPGAGRAVDGHEAVGRGPDHHHAGPEGVGQPLLGRAQPGKTAMDRCRPRRVHHRPHLLAGRARPPSATAGHRGMGERRHQHWSDGVGEVPAGGGPGRRPGLDIDLDGGRGAHHRAAGEPLGVEEGLHGGVAGLVEDPLRPPERVEAPGHRLDADGPQGDRDGGEVGGGGGNGKAEAP